MSTLAITNAAVGILLILVSLPLIANIVKPNPVYGFRTRRTLHDPDIWYAANHYAGIQLFSAGICIAILAVILALVHGLSPTTYSFISLAIIFVPLIVALVRSIHFVNSLNVVDDNRS